MAEKPFDPTLKTLVETTPEAWPAVVGQPPGPTTVVDADISVTVSGAADKVLRVSSKPPYLLHLEFVSGHDAKKLPRQLHLRNTILDHRHKLPVHSVGVLLHPGANSPTVNGTYQRRRGKRPPHVTFTYDVLRVWEKPPTLFLTGGPGLVPLAALSDVTKEQLPGIIKQIEAALQQQTAEARAELMAATYALIGLRYSKDEANALFQGVPSMKESVTYQAILAEGALEEARKWLRRLGDKRFGPPDAATVAALAAVSDVEELEALGERLFTTASWQELLPRPAAER